VVAFTICAGDSAEKEERPASVRDRALFALQLCGFGLRRVGGTESRCRTRMQTPRSPP
jgi:hypothetical protein